MQWDHVAVGIGLVAAIIIVVFGVVRFLNHRIDVRLQALFQEKVSNKAKIADRCMVREGYREEPAIVQLSDDRISIWTVSDQSIELLLPSTKLTRVRHNNWLGRYPWWGKTLLYLQAPNQDGLVLGIKDANPWIRVLEENSGNSQGK